MGRRSAVLQEATVNLTCSSATCGTLLGPAPEREIEVCATSFFILIMAGYPWQLHSRWEPLFFKGEKCGVSSKAFTGWLCTMNGPLGSELLPVSPTGSLSSIIHVWHSIGQCRTIRWACRPLASSSGPVWPQLVRNHINMLRQALQMGRLRIAGRSAWCLLHHGWSGSSITVLNRYDFFPFFSFSFFAFIVFSTFSNWAATSPLLCLEERFPLIVWLIQSLRHVGLREVHSQNAGGTDIMPV